MDPNARRAAAIAKIVEKLSAPIPPPPKVAPKQRASWRGWKVGDRVTSSTANGVQWEVEAVDSEGVMLRVVVPFRGALLRRVEDQQPYTKVRRKVTHEPSTHEPAGRRRGQGSRSAGASPRAGGCRQTAPQGGGGPSDGDSSTTP